MKELPGINIRSNDWIELRVWLLNEVEREKNRLCGNLTQEETIQVRGVISAYKHILDLEKRLLNRNQTQA